MNMLLRTVIRWRSIESDPQPLSALDGLELLQRVESYLFARSYGVGAETARAELWPAVFVIRAAMSEARFAVEFPGLVPHA